MSGGVMKSVEMKVVRFTLNGEAVEVGVGADETLVWTLRERFGLNGIKMGCDHGDCGACTVFLDREPILSCLVLAAEAEGHSIETIEDPCEVEEHHCVHEVFLDEGAVQYFNMTALQESGVVKQCACSRTRNR